MDIYGGTVQVLKINIFQIMSIKLNKALYELKQSRKLGVKDRINFLWI